MWFQNGSYPHVEGGEGDLSAEGMSVWGRKKKVKMKQWLELDPEVYPLYIMCKYGTLVGAKTLLLMNNVDMDDALINSHVLQLKKLPGFNTSFGIL